MLTYGEMQHNPVFKLFAFELQMTLTLTFKMRQSQEQKF